MTEVAGCSTSAFQCNASIVERVPDDERPAQLVQRRGFLAYQHVLDQQWPKLSLRTFMLSNSNSCVSADGCILPSPYSLCCRVDASFGSHSWGVGIYRLTKARHPLLRLATHHDCKTNQLELAGLLIAGTR